MQRLFKVGERETDPESAEKLCERAETRFGRAGRRAIKVNRVRPLFNKTSASVVPDFRQEPSDCRLKVWCVSEESEQRRKLLFPPKLSKVRKRKQPRHLEGDRRA